MDRAMANILLRLPNGSTSANFDMFFNQLSRWFIPREQIDFDQFDAFSEGAFGSVHKGKWFQTPVIVKRVKQHTTTETQFRQEADVWFQLNHINVVKMYGACDIGDLFFACEYASGGDLDKYLDSKGRDPYLMWYCLLNAALGLQYLHNNGIVHADLKANNILVGGDGVAKLTDFGLSVRAKDPSGASAGALGAYQWKAPECLSGSVATFASDVYSFAMVMIEVMSGSCPWGIGTEDVYVKVQVKKGLLPPRPSSIGDSEWGLIERMCARNPTERVTMDGVVVHLSSLLQKLDQKQLWHESKTFSNHNSSRDGIILSLIELANCKNGKIALYTANQFVSIARSRDGTSDQRELDAIQNMLLNGTEQQKFVAARAVAALASGNFSILKSKQVVAALVAMTEHGTVDQKEHAANALANLAGEGDISEQILSVNGIKPLITLVCDGDKEQKDFAAVALYNLTFWRNISEVVVAEGGVDSFVELMRSGLDTHKSLAVKALIRCSISVNIGQSVLDAGGIRLLVNLMYSGKEDQETYATMAIVNLTASTDISEAILAARGIYPLVKLVRGGTDTQKELAAHALSNLCVGDEIIETVITEGGIIPMAELLCDGTDSAKTFVIKALAKMSARSNITMIVLFAGGVNPLLKLLRDGTDEQKEHGATLLASLCAHENISRSVRAGFGIESLALLLRRGTDGQKSGACVALASLALRSDISEAVIAENGIELLVQLMRSGTNEHKRKAAMALGNLAMNSDISAPVLAAGGIEPLVSLVRHGLDSSRTAAATALGNLSARADISEPMLAASGIGPVIQLVRDGTQVEKRHAVRILAAMSARADISRPVLSSRGIHSLVQLLREGNDLQKTLATRAIANLSTRADIFEPVASAGGLELLFQLVQSGSDVQRQVSRVALSNLEGYLVTLSAREVEPIVKLLKDGTCGQKKQAALALARMPRVNTAEAVVKSGGLEPLLELFRAGTDDEITAALLALDTLSFQASVLGPAMLPQDSVTLLRLVQTGNDDQRRASAKVLAKLSGCEDYLRLVPGGEWDFKSGR